jgi:hypothetical protein
MLSQRWLIVLIDISKERISSIFMFEEQGSQHKAGSKHRSLLHFAFLLKLVFNREVAGSMLF